MGTAFLLKENGVDEIKIEQDRNVCVMSEGIFYCKDPENIKVARNFIGWTRLRPLNEAQLELVTEFYDKLDEGDFLVIADYAAFRERCLKFFVLVNKELPLSNFTWWIVTCNIRSVLAGWNSYAWKHAIENSIGYYVSNGHAIAGSLIKGIKITKIAPPNAYINLKGLYGLERAVNDIVKFRKKTRSVVIWYRSNIYRFDRFCKERIAEILNM